MSILGLQPKVPQVPQGPVGQILTHEGYAKIANSAQAPHVLEKLSAAARVLDGPAQAPTRVNRWRLALLNRRPAATEILAELVASGLDEGPGADHPVHAAITYLRSNTEAADRLNYARARRRGLPLGSGNVEATCKSLFELRLKRCGSR